MADFKKTTLVKYQGQDHKWHVLEDRISAHENEEVWDVDKMVVFLQEPKTNRFGEAFFCERVLNFDVDCNRVGTLSPKQRKLINDGIQEVNCEDPATRVCLKATATCGTN
eukprot:8742281-Karenia_brevis.AAC.1